MAEIIPLYRTRSEIIDFLVRRVGLIADEYANRYGLGPDFRHEFSRLAAPELRSMLPIGLNMDDSLRFFELLVPLWRDGIRRGIEQSLLRRGLL